MDLDDTELLSSDVDWSSTTSLMFDIANFKTLIQLSDNNNNIFINLLTTNKNLFAYNINEVGCCKVLKHEIRLMDNRPIFQRPYRKSMGERKEIQKQID